MVFCRHCGEPVKAKEMPLASPFQNTLQKKEKKNPLPIIVLLLLFAAGGMGAALYLTGNSYHCKKNIEQAEQYLEEGEYEEALACCEEALELNEQCVDAYLVSADIYIELDSYGKAAGILEKGRKKVKDQDPLDEKLEEVYRAQAKALIGTWKLNYNLINLIPEEYRGLLNLDMEVPILLEIRADGVMYFSVEQEYFAGAQEALSSIVNAAVTAYVKLPFVGGAAGHFSELLTGLLIDNIGITYTYEVKEDVLHCIWLGEDAAEETYAFEIDGTTLTILEEQTPGANSYYLKFPLTLKKL